MRIALVFDKTAPHTTGAYFERVLQQSRFRVDHYWTSRPDTVPDGYDLYVRIDHGDYAHDLPARCRPSVFYAIDTHLPKPYRRIRGQAAQYDLVCCAQQAGARRLTRELRRPVEWLPLACDPDLHTAHDTRRTCDVAFVGTDGKHGARPILLRLLRTRYPNGFFGQAPHTRLGALYGSARIGFNCSVRDDVNMRVFEVLAAGALLVTNRLADSGMEEMFADGVHYVSYRNRSELLRVIEHYLKHDEERERIAEAGRRHVLKHHTYRRRTARLLALLSARLRDRYPHLAVERTLPLLEAAGRGSREPRTVSREARNGAAV